MKKPSISTITERFSTRDEAEKYIAEHDLAGKKKARHVGGKWFLVANPEGTINRSLFTKMLYVERVRVAKKEGWLKSELAAALVDVPRDAERIWRQMTRDRKKKLKEVAAQ
jgi:hypothetical protein